MRRDEFIEEINNIYDLMDFCWNNNYDSFVENIYGDESRNEYIENDISERRSCGDSWWEIRDWLYSIDDHGDYDYWRLDDWGDWQGVDDCLFEELKENLLEELDSDGFFEDADEDDEEADDYCDDGNPRFDEPVGAASLDDLLEPGNFADALGGIEGVPQYDSVVAMNLARLRAAEDERIRVDQEFQRIMEESNRLTAGDFSAVFQ